MTDWDPSRLPDGTLSAWYKADSISGSDGDSVSAWSDSSGNGNDLSQASSSLQPSLQTNELNGKSVVRFDGSNDLLSDSDIAALDVGTGDIWMAAVFKSTDTSAEQIVVEKSHTVFGLLITAGGDLQFRFGGPGGSNAATQNSGNWSRTEFVIASGARVSSTVSGFVNGTATNTTGVTNTQSIDNSDVLDIGGRASGATGDLNGDVAEILVGGATLNTKQRQQIEGYLAHKYGLQGNLPSDHPYKTNAPQRAVDWTPSFLPAGNLAGWYKADAITGLSDGDAVASWVDSSGNGNTLTQSTSGAKPSYETNEVNSLPIVRFDRDASPGDNLFNADLGGDFEPGTGDFYIAMVAKFPSSGGAAQFVMTKADSGTQGLNVFISGSNFIFRPQTVGGTTNFLEQNSVVDTSFHTIVCRRVSSTLGSEYDGSAFTNDNGSKVNDGDMDNDANFNVGSSSTGGLDADMDLAEVLIAVGTLSDVNLQRITGYLAHKYGLEANLPADHPFRHIKPIIKISNAFSSGLIDGGLIQA